MRFQPQSPRRSRASLLAAFSTSALLIAAATNANAQGGFGSPGMSGSGMGGPGMGGGSMGMPGGRPAPAAQKKKPNTAPPGTPEMHAASGGGETTLPQGSEPTLPADPLAISDALRAQIGTDSGLVEPDLGAAIPGDRDFYGLYYQETQPDYKLKLAFPLWFERQQPSLTDPNVVDRASVYGSVYYNRRSAERADDVVFPFFWNLRDQESRTTIVGPLVNRVAPNESDNWLAPLYFFGEREHGSYQVIPPLLTYMNHDAEGGFNLIGSGFCSWLEGNSCFGETKEQDFGVAPLYFSGHDSESQYSLIPPLLHYYKKDDREQTELNIWGPYYREHTETTDSLHLMPFYWSKWGKDERHTTVFPFFHYGWEKNSELFVNPLFLSKTSEDGAKTFATWGYARYRGRTELDMYSPLVWLYRDPDAGIDQKLIFPFFYSYDSPREDSLALFPFYGNFKRHSISESTWITPLFNHTTNLTGWSTSIYPLVYFGREGHESHSILAPIFYDFSSPQERSTVVFPFFWRFAEPSTLTQLVGNFLYTEKNTSKGDEWSFRALPAFGFGETAQGHWWSLLFGLVGYERDGAKTEAKLFWLPITLTDGE